MRLTGAELLWECLVRHGVTTVFGYPGGAILPVYDAMPRYPIRHVLVRHEQGATHMADGYARASDGIGVAIATSGPGATNMVTGLATAMMDSSPVLCITGQVNSHLLGTDAFQEVDITTITQSITKKNYLVTRVEEIAPAVCDALRTAHSGRPGPVLVDITKDAQQASCEVDEAALRIRCIAPVQRDGSNDDEALAMIAAARRPVVLAGHGVAIAGAQQALRRFAERTDIPIACTLLGLDVIPASHRLNLGMMGLHGHAWVNEAIQEADLLIAIGMRFDDRVTGDPRRYALGAKKIHVDIDGEEINKIVPVDIAIVDDARCVLEAWSSGAAAASRADWNGLIVRRRQDALRRDILGQATSCLYTAHIIDDLSRITQGRALIVTDVGQHQMWAAQYYRHEQQRSLVTSGGSGTMGFALPAAIGAKIACPHREVWVIVGDGGFQMSMAELATIVQEGLDVNIAIINNACLGMVRQLQHHWYGERYIAAPLTGPDFTTIARAYGIAAAVVERRHEVADAIHAARRQHGPALIDFRVALEDAVYPTVRAGAPLNDMLRRPLEDTDAPHAFRA
jgi:acetolactate synthase I/II/III large subunit